MADLIGLFDRDVFLKLGCCNLWQEALACLGVTHPYRLASTTSAASNRRVLGKGLDGPALDEACSRVSTIVATVPVIPLEFLSLANAWIHRSRLLAEPDIGLDVVLVGIFFMMQDARVLVTGDKRLLGSLREHIPSEFAAASHQMITFEACLRAVTETYGFNHVFPRVSGVASCDGTLKRALGHTGKADESEFLTALQSYDPLRKG